MTITIDLAPDDEARLRKRASRQGRDVEGLIREIALVEASREAAAEAQDEMPKPGESLAEFLAGYIGVVDSSKNNGGQVSHSAENASQEFTDYVVEKHKAGHL